MLPFGSDVALLIAGMLRVLDLLALRHAWQYLYQLTPAVVGVGDRQAGCCALLLSDVSVQNLTAFGRYLVQQHVPFLSVRGRLSTEHQIVRLCRYIAHSRPQQVCLCITGPVSKVAGTAIGELLTAGSISTLSITNQFRQYPSELQGFLPPLGSGINATPRLADLVLLADSTRVPEWWVVVAKSRSLRTAKLSFRQAIDMCGVGLGHLWSGESCAELRSLHIRLGCLTRPSWVVRLSSIAPMRTPKLRTFVLTSLLIGSGLLKAVIDAIVNGVHNLRVLELHLRGSSSLGRSGGLDALAALGPLERIFLDVQHCKITPSRVARVLMQLLQKVNDITVCISQEPGEVARMVHTSLYRTMRLELLAPCDFRQVGDVLRLTQAIPCLRMLKLSAVMGAQPCDLLPTVRPYAAGPCFVRLRVNLAETTTTVGHVTMSASVD